jgi:hypothetical protein
MHPWGCISSPQMLEKKRIAWALPYSLSAGTPDSYLSGFCALVKVESGGVGRKLAPYQFGNHLAEMGQD